MPIHVSEYTWYQTAEKIILSLDLHHTSPKNVDIVATSSYLKVSFLPYIFEGFLSGCVDAEHSRAKAVGGRLELDLVKEVVHTWPDVCVQLTPEEKWTRRQDAQKEMEEQETKREKKMKEERNQRERYAVSRQISTDDLMRDKRKQMIEEIKTDFLRQADRKNSQEEKTEEIEEDGRLERKKEDELVIEEGGIRNCEVREEQQQQRRRRWSSAGSEDHGPVVEQDYDGDGEDSMHYSSSENVNQLTGNHKVENINRKHKKIPSNRKAADKEKDGQGATAKLDKTEMKEGMRPRESQEKKKEGRKKKSLPPVRQHGSITIRHTARVFPTPSRESTQEEEEQWLSKQSAIPTAPDKGDNSDTCKALEHFKKKAVFLFKSGDYRGCVNACTEALALAPMSSTFFSNRSAANLALGNLHHAVNDCSKALELLMPSTPANLKSRLLSHVRRGTAFVRLGLVSEGLADYEAALALTPEDTSLQQDVARLKDLARGTDSEDESDSGCGDIPGGPSSN
ncbi:hypothetical protein Pmani_003598 [Petrolisthes manimaculis]|uniref:CS domain-containing protein n=1 Tax=Petrolisthes manimaculis TaxID=1843537 RepID=A0AAE1UI92_9EUCA|nr:hypothetical protein Pmani_003598 [Petrolisthes manimaculis]